MASKLRRGSRIGKYRILRTLGSGGFAKVYLARDEVEGRKVALKVPHPSIGDSAADDLLKEVRISVRLDHPNILPIRNADMIDGRLVIAYPLCEETLGDRLKRRISAAGALEMVESLLEAVAYAHSRRVIHCDINPHNVLIDASGVAKLADFGIAKVAHRTQIAGSGSGTVGYLAPEQAMGQLSFRSDVFSVGLIAYRVFAGQLPKWPFKWPLEGHERLKRKLTPEAIAWIRKSIAVDDTKRYANGASMLRAYNRLPEVLR